MVILTAGYDDGQLDSGGEELQEGKSNLVVGDTGDDLVLPDGGVVTPDGGGDISITPANPDLIGVDSDEAYY